MIYDHRLDLAIARVLIAAEAWADEDVSDGREQTPADRALVAAIRLYRQEKGDPVPAGARTIARPPRFK